jgi:hypothetical protein
MRGAAASSFIRARVFVVGEELASEVEDRVVPDTGLVDGFCDLGPDPDVVLLVLLQVFGTKAQQLSDPLGHCH